MADLVIKQNELKELDTLLGDIPMKFGMPLVNFINKVVGLRAQEAQAAQQSMPAGTDQVTEEKEKA